MSGSVIRSSTVHAADVIHSHVTPRNFMLNAALDLHIAGFAGCSIAGSASTVTTSPRFQPPSLNWKGNPGKENGTFALGSILYVIMAVQEPYADLEEDEVQRLFTEAKFPDVSQLTCGDIIRGCWMGTVESAYSVATALTKLYAAESPDDTIELRWYNRDAVIQRRELT